MLGPLRSRNVNSMSSRYYASELRPRSMPQEFGSPSRSLKANAFKHPALTPGSLISCFSSSIPYRTPCSSLASAASTMPHRRSSSGSLLRCSRAGSSIRAFDNRFCSPRPELLNCGILGARHNDQKQKPAWAATDLTIGSSGRARFAGTPLNLGTR